LAGEDAVERLFGLTPLGDGALYDLAMHRSDRLVVLEFEPGAQRGRIDHTSYVRPLIERIRGSDRVEQLCAGAVRQIQALTGFDRVMAYRFHGDASGEVIAESAAPGMEPYLGLRYPASDIPKQARALYERNMLRIITDVNGALSPIHADAETKGAPLDLSLGTLRAVSPMHVQYLKNMGVAASMSISILKRGKLWGLIACHHREPRRLDLAVRAAAELFGQLFSYVLDQVEVDAEQAHADRARKLHDRLVGRLVEGARIDENFDMVASALGTVIDFDGAAAWVGGRFVSHGEAPDEDAFMQIVKHLTETAKGEVWATDRLAEAIPAAASEETRAAGLLALPVSRRPRDYVVLFRREVATQVDWAGDPNKPVAEDGETLTPRTSFALWKEDVRGRSKPWTPGEMKAAETLRVTLLEVVLRLTEQANQERAKSQERQEVLIAELNHRVRNILNLIRGLVNQSGAGVETVAEFTHTVGGRIHALARAHDQITRQNWVASSVKALVATEVEAYVSDKAHRVRLSGPDAMVEPQAYSTLSLVIHEMMTNSAKYGALTDARGHIEVELARTGDGGLRLDWSEHGGPKVAPPQRRGFGSTIIERSIPFELRGEAEIRYEPDGVVARFELPANHVAEFLDASDEAQAERAPEAEAEARPLDGDVLIVEDNVIIALDAEQIMRDLGAREVAVVSSVAEALRLIETRAFACALLDVNLGVETSAPVAERLAKDGVPFVFATGYGEQDALVERYDDAPILQKPYEKDDVRRELFAAIEASRA
ncbi:MAG: HWE histidine kinase domain-containing protein, partial [Oceanicaulis sp.]